MDPKRTHKVHFKKSISKVTHIFFLCNKKGRDEKSEREKKRRKLEKPVSVRSI